MYDTEHCLNEEVESIEKRWTQILLNWINKCVNSKIEVSELNATCLLDVMKKYNRKWCARTPNQTFTVDDVEAILKKEYPLLILRNLTQVYEPSYQFKKLYISITVLLYHACMSKKSRAAVVDICSNMEKIEMEMILKLCEKLKSVEITAMNIEASVKGAYEGTYGLLAPSKTVTKNEEIKQETQAIDKELVAYQPPPKEEDNIGPRVINPSKKDLETSNLEAYKELLAIQPPQKEEGEIRKRDVIKISKKYLETSKLSTERLPNSKSSMNLSKSFQQNDIILHKVESIDSGSTDVFRKRCPTPVHSDLDMCVLEDSEIPCKSNCTCTRCSYTVGSSCGDPGNSMSGCDIPSRNASIKLSKDSFIPRNEFEGNKWNLYCALATMVIVAVAIVILLGMALTNKGEETEDGAEKTPDTVKMKRKVLNEPPEMEMQWQCKNQFCVKTKVNVNGTMYHRSLSRCTLLCMGPQIWPHPIGYTHYSKSIIAVITTNLEYKFQSVPSEAVHHYLAAAFKLFLKGLFRLEGDNQAKQTKENKTIDLPVKRMNIQIEVESDPDPRLRLNTEEAYMIKFQTEGDRITIKIISASFCGVRHGLETTSQLILLDQVTGYLISLSQVTIQDAPSFKYRGLMLDTGRNFIPVSDIKRTIDAMASCKLNTFHWRISGDTSFPLYLPKLPLLSEYGAYDRSMIYTKDDVRSIVTKAGLRGIRVLIEVTAPGPVGRPWSWFSQATCPRKSGNYTCENVLCMRLLMDTAVFNILQVLYSEILEMTGVNDIFHLSNGMFSMTNCYQLISDRDGFLKRALERLKVANKGVAPKLPIIWYTSHLMKDSEAKTWERLGVQLNDWDPNPGEQYLGKFRVIHSTNWDLSCEIKKQRCVKYRTWQEMYAWNSWRNVEVFSIEGGEAILWSDLVGSGNLDSLLWPRAAAVAERLWSDVTANSSANKYVYMRLDIQRWRMILLGIKVQPIWPAWCSFNPIACLARIRK